MQVATIEAGIAQTGQTGKTEGANIVPQKAKLMKKLKIR
jgi:hypothetical protein